LRCGCREKEKELKGPNDDVGQHKEEFAECVQVPVIPTLRLGGWHVSGYEEDVGDEEGHDNG
jgi:hypothetical protein